MFFNGEDQVLTIPNDRCMELIPVGPGGYGHLAVGCVALHCVPWCGGSADDGSLHGQLRIAVLDVQGDIACSPWHRAFVALCPCAGKIRVWLRADSGRGHKNDQEQAEEHSSFHMRGLYAVLEMRRRSFYLELQTQCELKLAWCTFSHRADRGSGVYRICDAAEAVH